MHLETTSKGNSSSGGMDFCNGIAMPKKGATIFGHQEIHKKRNLCDLTGKQKARPSIIAVTKRFENNWRYLAPILALFWRDDAFVGGSMTLRMRPHVHTKKDHQHLERCQTIANIFW